MSQPSSRLPETIITLGVSACLLGDRVRYNGDHSKNEFVTGMLGQLFRFEPVCPEIEIGLLIQRKPVRLVGDPQSPRAKGVSDSRLDITDKLAEYGEGFALNHTGKISGFIFKSRSPSCGLNVEVFSENGGRSSDGIGIFARKIAEYLPQLPMIEESKLDEEIVRENFVEKVYAYNRSRGIKDGGVTNSSHA